MVVGLLGIIGLSASGLSSPGGPLASAQFFMLAFFLSVVLVIVATFLIGAGLLVYRRGLSGLAWRDPATGHVHTVSRGTGTKAFAAAILIMLYGIFAIIAVISFSTLLAGIGALDLAAVFGSVSVIIFSWLAGALVLLAGGIFYKMFLGSLRRETFNPKAPGGTSSSFLPSRSRVS
jgi:hypothetical protein